MQMRCLGIAFVRSMPEPKSNWELIGLVFEFGIVVAVVMFAFLRLGAAADERWRTQPWGVMVGMIAAFLTIGVWIYYRIKPYL